MEGHLMAISRIRAVWTGFIGAPGVSTFYSLNPEVDVPLITGFFRGLITVLPLAVNITVDSSGDVLDETTGNLTGSWSMAAQEGQQGTCAGPYAAPVGMVVNWETGAVLDQSRLRGKTYLVPLCGSAFDANGTPIPEAVALVLGDAESLAAENSLVVWHRPRAARAADGSRPAVTARAGGYANIIGATVHDFAAVLTSRRD